MTAKKTTTTTPKATASGMRKCIGSAKFGIKAHDAPVDDFPIQPSQKDGLGRMCKPHWKEYVNALRKRALERKAAEGGVATEVAPTVQLQAAARVATKRAARVAKPEAIRTRPARGRKTEGEQIVEAVDEAIVPEAANVADASIA